MAKRKPSVELYYDPAELDPDAPRLSVRRDGDAWKLRDEAGDVLSTHVTQSDGIDAALELSRLRFSEILVRGTTGRAEWQVNQNPALLRLRECRKRDAGKRRRVDAGAFAGHHVFLPPRRRNKDSTGVAPRPTELVYDPAELDPAAPRLHIRKEGGSWELRDGEDRLISRHCLLPDAMDAALERSNASFSEILVRTAGGRFEWSLRHNPDWTELARVLNRPVGAAREAAD